jgi:hypothetical protein
MRLILIAALSFALPAQAMGPVPFGPGLEAAGWSELTFRGRVPAEFRAEAGDTLRVRTEGGVSVLYRPLDAGSGAAAEARWQWRVDAAVPATDLGRRGEDDRSLAVYFLFADDPDAAGDPPASLTAAMRRGRALVYVWGGDGAARSVVESPHMGARGRLIVQRPAASPGGEWLTEAVDLRADFRSAFGREPGPLVGLAVSADSDDTASVSDARIAELVLQ